MTLRERVVADYADLRVLVREMESTEADDAWHMTATDASNARAMLAGLSAACVPAPKILPMGADGFSLIWHGRNSTLHLTFDHEQAIVSTVVPLGATHTRRFKGHNFRDAAIAELRAALPGEG